jgi:hypothetical protein
VNRRAAPGLVALEQRQHHVGIDLVAGFEVDDRHTHLGGRARGIAGDLHIAAHGLDDRIITRHIGVFRSHRRDARPDQVRLDSTERGVIDAERLVAGRQRIAAEDVDLERRDQSAENFLPARMLEVQRDRFLAHIGGNEITAPILIGDAASDIAVGVAGETAVRLGCLDADHAPAELRKAQRRRRHRKRLLQAENGAAFHPSAP